MRLLRLAGSGFRNLEPFELACDAPFVVLHGPNGQGKTNALEAVYLLCTLQGLRGRRRGELIRWGAERAAVQGDVRADDVTHRYGVDLSEAARGVELDGKRVHDLAEYFASIRCVCFTPQDGRIVTEEPAWRRRWVDRAAFTAQPAHLGVSAELRRVLLQKAAALKDPRPDGTLLDVLDDQLARVGAEVVTRRVEVLAELQPHVQQLVAGLAGAPHAVSLRYRTDASGGDRGAREASLRRALEAARANELRRRTTLVGPQTDDVDIDLEGHPARTYASRGQVRSLVLALKLAELVAARRRGEVPLFLLDDVSSELDRARTARLVAILAELRAQVWATTTDPEHMEGLPRHDTLRIMVSAGSLAIVRDA